jgi:hypothetical protein
MLALPTEAGWVQSQYGNYGEKNTLPLQGIKPWFKSCYVHNTAAIHLPYLLITLLENFITLKLNLKDMDIVLLEENYIKFDVDQGNILLPSSGSKISWARNQRVSWWLDRFTYRLHSATSQKMATFITTAVRTSYHIGLLKYLPLVILIGTEERES